MPGPPRKSHLDRAGDLVVQSISNVAQRLNIDRELRGMRASCILESRRGMAAKQRLERERERLLSRSDALRDELKILLAESEIPTKPACLS